MPKRLPSFSRKVFRRRVRGPAAGRGAGHVERQAASRLPGQPRKRSQDR